MVRMGRGLPVCLSSALVNSTTVPPVQVVAHKLPEGSKVRPPGQSRAGKVSDLMETAGDARVLVSWLLA